MEELWVSNRDQTLAGQKVSKGQIIKPAGSINDRIIFNDNSRWAFPMRVGEPIECGTDGCKAQFDCTANLLRHREIVHKPERDERTKGKAEKARYAREAEEAGETIGGREVVKVKRGPGGEVPYISPT